MAIAAAFKAHGVSDRDQWLCDSFNGLPRADPRYHAGAAPRTAAPSQDALLGVFTFEKALWKNTGGGGGPGGARPWVG